jgi:hypothetical protein
MTREWLVYRATRRNNATTAIWRVAGNPEVIPKLALWGTPRQQA